MASAGAVAAASAAALAASVWHMVASAYLRRPLVVGIVGVSCSGKSTIASRLARALNGKHAEEAICQDAFFDYDRYATDKCPVKKVTAGPCKASMRSAVETRHWKNWESPEAIDWGAFIAAVRDAAGGSERVVVVEGFLLHSWPESAALFDVIIAIDIADDLLWERRRARALSMAVGAHVLPRFFGGVPSAASLCPAADG